MYRMCQYIGYKPSLYITNFHKCDPIKIYLPKWKIWINSKWFLVIQNWWEIIPVLFSNVLRFNENEILILIILYCIIQWNWSFYNSINLKINLIILKNDQYVFVLPCTWIKKKRKWVYSCHKRADTNKIYSLFDSFIHYFCSIDEKVKFLIVLNFLSSLQVNMPSKQKVKQRRKLKMIW